MKKMIFLLLKCSVLSSMLAVGACNTVKGMGQDFKATGEAISETADDVEEKM